MEIIKRATKVKEVFFEGFNPSMQVIEMLPDCLEHLSLLKLEDSKSYSGKFRRLKSLNLYTGFDFF